MARPYPGYSPNQKSVTTTGGYHRNCLVIDILSLAQMNPAEIAMLEEQVSAQLAKLSKTMPNIHKCELITPDRFDRILSEGLRLG